MAVTSSQWIMGLGKLYVIGFALVGLTGLSLMEAGYSRPKHISGVLLKNFYQLSIGMIAYWLLGYGFSFGDVDDLVIGTEDFAGDDWEGTVKYIDAALYGLLGMIVVFSINLPLTERVQFPVQMVYTFIIMVLLYPMVVAWSWGGGWLDDLDEPFRDPGGAANIHLFAGAFATVGIFASGKRFGFGNQDFSAASNSLATIGGLLFAISLFYVNTISYTNLPSYAASGPFNCWVAGGTSCLLTLFIASIILKDIGFHFNLMIEGFLAGVVGVSSVANNTEGWDAFVIGLIVGIATAVVIRVEKQFNVDDVSHTLAWQVVAPFIGIFLCGFFDDAEGVAHEGNGELLGSQLLGAVVILIWGAIFGAIVFVVSRVLNLLRIPDAVQEVGLRESKLHWKGWESGMEAPRVEVPSETPRDGVAPLP